MIFSRRLLLVCLLAAVAPLAFAAERAKPTRPAADTGIYKGAIVTDATTGAVLYEDRSTVVTPPASMTKLMTFAVLREKISQGALRLDTPVKITAEDSKIGGTQVFLDPRETFPVEELIYAMMIQSANDASHALARAAAGSVPAFVDLMNAKARELGMTQTTFRTPHGLPPSSRQLEDGDLTTPRDFALLSRHLLTKTDVLKYTSVNQRPFGTGVRAQPQVMRNHNNLLGKVAGVDGLKTGYTAGAGYCLSVTAERNGRRVIAVIMGAFGPGGQIDKGKARDLKAVELIQRGFAALPPGGAPFVTVKSAEATPVIVATKPEAAKPAKPASAAPESAAPMIKFSIPPAKK